MTPEETLRQQLAESQARERLRANLIRRLVRLLGGCPDHPDGCGSHRYRVVRIMEEAQAELANPVAIEPTDIEKRLTESQARETALRKAASNLMFGCDSPKYLREAVSAALALPVDSSALDAALKKAWAEGRSAGIESMRGPMHDQRRMGQEEGAATERARTAAAEANAAHLDGLHTNACVRMGELAAEAGAAEARELAVRKVLGPLTDLTGELYDVDYEAPAIELMRARTALAAPADSTALRALMVKAATAQREADHTFASDGPETRPEAVVDAVLAGGES